MWKFTTLYVWKFFIAGVLKRFFIISYLCGCQTHPMKKTIENRIRFNALLIYCIIALVCCGMIAYVYHLKTNIDDQKRNIEQYNHTLTLISELISTVQEAQSATHFFASSKQSNYLSQFKQLSGRIDTLIDSLVLLEGDMVRRDHLNEITDLLAINKSVVSDLNRQLKNYNPLDSIHSRLQNYNPSEEYDSVVLVTTRKDTVIQALPKKGFWQRMVDLFAPEKNKDEIVTVSTVHSDTIRIAKADTLNVLTDVRDYSEKASQNYTRRINSIKKQVGDLMETDQEISSQISTLLIGYYRETLQSVMKEIQQSESLIGKNYLFLLIGGIFSLLLILVLILLIIHNVNKGYHTRKALEDANALTRRVMDERHKLLLSVSHDIKAPLTSILGSIELWGETQPDSKEKVLPLLDSGHYILGLLNNLLEFSRLEQGTLTLECCRFNVYTLCRECTEMLIPLAQRRGLDFEWESGMDPNQMLCSDRLRIKQIIINILSNSIKYTTSGFVRFSASYSEGKLSLSMEDTGIGMPEEKLTAIFEPFSRIEHTNSMAGGQGFGLYVVKGLMDLLNGEITVTSAPGKGTLIRLVIPDLPLSEKAMENPCPDNNTLLSSKPYHILLVDDDPVILKVASDMLKRLGHKTAVSSSLAELVYYKDFLNENGLIITDMEMGSFSGPDVLAQVRKTNASLPVVIMTARGDYDAARALEAGFAAYLAKPFSLKSLISLVGNFGNIDNHRAGNSCTRFPLLYEMMEGDESAVSHILHVFTVSTEEQLKWLESKTEEEDFAGARYLCHKMLSVFSQLEANTLTPFLKKMDALKDDQMECYPEWKEDTAVFIREAEEFLQDIREHYSPH